MVLSPLVNLASRKIGALRQPLEETDAMPEAYAGFDPSALLEWGAAHAWVLEGCGQSDRMPASGRAEPVRPADADFRDCGSPAELQEPNVSGHWTIGGGGGGRIESRLTQRETDGASTGPHCFSSPEDLTDFVTMFYLEPPVGPTMQSVPREHFPDRPVPSSGEGAPSIGNGLAEQQCVPHWSDTLQETSIRNQQSQLPDAR